MGSLIESVLNALSQFRGVPYLAEGRAVISTAEGNILVTPVQTVRDSIAKPVPPHALLAAGA